MKGQLFHQIPSWVPSGSRFHIRIRIESNSNILLTDSQIGQDVLTAADFCHTQHKWFVHLLLLMPDHLHAIIAFPPGSNMSRVVGEWKSYLRKAYGIRWQKNYFDHRLRDEKEFIEKAYYIRMNPVRAGLAARSEDWNWVIEHKESWG